MPTRPVTYAEAKAAFDLAEAKRGAKSPANAAAKESGLARGTFMNRYRAAIGRFGFKHGEKAPAPPPETPASLDGGEAGRRHVQQADEINRLKAALKEAHRKSLDDDAMRDALGILAKAPESPPDWVFTTPKKHNHAPETPVACWNDWHGGEVVSRSETGGINEFNLEILERRVHKLVDRIVHLCKHHHSRNYPGIVINLIGDFISGGLHPELAKTDAEEAIPAALRVRDILVSALTHMADEFGRVYVPCAAGNHGRNTPKPEFKRYAYKNFDWLIYQLLYRHFVKDDRIHFDIRPANEVHYRVFGRRFLMMHGDMLGVRGGDGIIGSIGPIVRGEIKVGTQARSMNRDFDMLIMGHWHQEIPLPWLTVSNTLKGFDEYTRLQLRARPSVPSQSLWFEHPDYGRTAYWNIQLEPRATAGGKWVEWQNG